jgi:hypothetical protein
MLTAQLCQHACRRQLQPAGASSGTQTSCAAPTPSSRTNSSSEGPPPCIHHGHAREPFTVFIAFFEVRSASHPAPPHTHTHAHTQAHTSVCKRDLFPLAVTRFKARGAGGASQHRRAEGENSESQISILQNCLERDGMGTIGQWTERAARPNSSPSRLGTAHRLSQRALRAACAG